MSPPIFRQCPLAKLIEHLFSDYYNSIYYINQLSTNIRKRNNTQSFPAGRRKSDRRQPSNDISNIYHSCNKCGKSYTTIYNLKRHLRFECGVDPQFECVHCGTKFKHKHHLTDHIRSCCTKLYAKN